MVCGFAALLALSWSGISGAVLSGYDYGYGYGYQYQYDTGHVIVVKHVVPGGAATASDFTMHITGVTATGGNDFPGKESPGTDKEVTLKIARGKEEKEMQVQLATMPGEGIAGMPPRGFPQGLNPAVFQQMERLPDMERRIQELENRIRALEQKLKEKSGEGR